MCMCMRTAVCVCLLSSCFNQWVEECAIRRLFGSVSFLRFSFFIFHFSFVRSFVHSHQQSVFKEKRGYIQFAQLVFEDASSSLPLFRSKAVVVVVPVWNIPFVFPSRLYDAKIKCAPSRCHGVIRSFVHLSISSVGRMTMDVMSDQSFSSRMISMVVVQCSMFDFLESLSGVSRKASHQTKFCGQE